MTPEQLLEQLKKEASDTTQETLNAIYDVCLEQKERGISDFSISTIAKLGYKRGVPKAQSIRNKSGEKYKALISSFAENSPAIKPLKTLSKSETDWINEISNPKHQLLTRIMASELKEAKQVIQEIIPPNQRIEIHDFRNTSLQDVPRLSEQEKRALQYIISDTFKTKWSLTENEFGELTDERGVSVFKASTVDAIRKALDFLS
mgnify:CR=1 FL=1